jgi:hypothetical protein
MTQLSSKMLKKSASGVGRLRIRSRLRKKESARRLTLTSTSAYLTRCGLLDGLFEHPACSSPVIPDERASEVLAWPHSFSTAC